MSDKLARAQHRRAPEQNGAHRANETQSAQPRIWEAGETGRIPVIGKHAGTDKAAELDARRERQALMRSAAPGETSGDSHREQTRRHRQDACRIVGRPHERAPPKRAPNGQRRPGPRACARCHHRRRRARKQGIFRRRVGGAHERLRTLLPHHRVLENMGDGLRARVVVPLELLSGCEQSAEHAL